MTAEFMDPVVEVVPTTTVSLASSATPQPEFVVTDLAPAMCLACNTHELLRTVFSHMFAALKQEVRQAFKKLALVFHPDKNPHDKAAHDKFLQINTAFEVQRVALVVVLLVDARIKGIDDRRRTLSYRHPTSPGPRCSKMRKHARSMISTVKLV